MSDRFKRYQQNNNNYIEFVGFDFGYSVKVKILKESEKYLMVYISGGNHWSGLGKTSYSSPEMCIYEKYSENEIVDYWDKNKKYIYECSREQKKKSVELANQRWKELHSRKRYKKKHGKK